MEATRSDIYEALEELGVSADMAWEQIRASYRKQIRAAHPDLVDSNSAATEAARLNLAFGILVKATDNGKVPLSGTRNDNSTSYALELSVSTEDIFRQFISAAHNLGEVTYISREDGLINVLLGQNAQERTELLIILEIDADPITALFTLESHNQATSLDIHSLVTHFQELLSIEFGAL